MDMLAAIRTNKDNGALEGAGRMQQELRVSIYDNAADQSLALFMSRLLQEIDPDQRRPLVLVAIGTDRLTGDSLGPLVGTRTRELAPGLPVYGTLEEPVHAVNLAGKIREIAQAFQEPLVIAVDACLGQSENVGTVFVGQGALLPGTGVHKDLPPVGEIFISGVVNVGGFMEYLVLQNTRLGLVMKIADCIARALVLACSARLRQHPAAAVAAAADDVPIRAPQPY
jgi:putative sporulation protein YyaC